MTPIETQANPVLSDADREQSGPRPLPRRPAVWVAGAAIAGLVAYRLWPEEVAAASGPMAVAVGLAVLVLVAVGVWRARRVESFDASTRRAKAWAWWSPIGILTLLGVAAAFGGYAAWWYELGPNGVTAKYPDGAAWCVIEGVVSEGMPSPPSDPARWDPESLIESEGVDDQTERDAFAASGAEDDEAEAPPRSDSLPPVFQAKPFAPPSLLLSCERDHVTGTALVGTVRVVFDKIPRGAREFRAGDRIQVRGELRPLLPARNLGETDLRLRSLDRGVHGTLNLKAYAHATFIESTSSFPLQHACEAARAWMLSLASSPNFDHPPHPLFSALVLGDGSGLSRDTRDVFVRSGGIHILVVSGLHIMVMGFGVWLLAAALGLGLRTRVVSVALVSLAFLALTGMGTPALRAATVVTCFAVARVYGRRADFLNLLAVSALIVLIRSPGDVFTPGFQLSYLCVLVLALFTPTLESLKPNSNRHAKTLPGAVALWLSARPRRFVHWLAVSLIGSLLVFIFTTPLAQAQWFIVSPVAIPLAVAAVPILFAILLLALALPVASLWEPAHHAISSGLYWLFTALESLASYFADLPHSHFWLPPTPQWWMWCFLIAALLLAFALRHHRMRLAAVSLVILWIGVLALIPSPHQADPTPKAHFLDVSQGSCVVLESPGAVLVADVGSQMRPHVGEWTVVPFLLSRGHRVVDVLMLSHVDADHINGAIALCDRLRVRELWISPVFEDAPNGQAILSELTRRVESVRRLEAVTHAKVGAFAVEVCWPYPNFASLARSQTTRTNAASLVIRAECPGLSVLLTGDAEDTATVGMVPVLRQTDVLQAPHHGSGFDNLPKLIAKTSPRHVVVSARESFPSKTTLDLFAQNAQVWPTFRYGCITFTAGRTDPSPTIP